MRPTNNPEIARTLVLSTAHVPGNLARSEKLDLESEDFFVPVEANEFGWTVFACMESAFEYIEDAPREHWFKPVLMVALENNCDRVQFDGAANVLEGLPTFDWED